MWVFINSLERFAAFKSIDGYDLFCQKIVWKRKREKLDNRGNYLSTNPDQTLKTLFYWFLQF